MSSAVTSVTPAVATAQPPSRSFRRDGLSILRRNSTVTDFTQKNKSLGLLSSSSSSMMAFSRKSSQGKYHPSTRRSSVLDSLAPSVYLSKEDVEDSLSSYKELIQTASKFQSDLKKLSVTASEFAHNMERFARVKGLGDSAVGLQASAGLHYVIATHFGILADSITQLIEEPLQKSLGDYEKKLEKEEIERQKTLAYISHKIKVTEARSMSAARHGTRDLNQFRHALNELSTQVDELENVNEDYYNVIHEWQQENGRLVLDQMSKFVRVESDILERITSKCLEDGSLQEMINEGPEPFSIYERVDTGEPPKDIFTTLPAVSLFEQYECTVPKPHSAILAKSSATLVTDEPHSSQTCQHDDTTPHSIHTYTLTPPNPSFQDQSSAPLLNPSLLYTWVGEFNPVTSFTKEPTENFDSAMSQSKQSKSPSINLYDLTPPTSQKPKPSHLDTIQQDII
ncbi:hypothetical protein DSO57_1003362 [Entomophthora muscae]|uniref:Uncharacterized protein n=1 Tax=Entomophthora muscae TaxID=34485 RepID=A0ACC2SXH5_9FUNG|nr:hypothetical protein DSO57_1003362 [Entomophthora muscae]